MYKIKSSLREQRINRTYIINKHYSPFFLPNEPGAANTSITKTFLKHSRNSQNILNMHNLISSNTTYLFLRSFLAGWKWEFSVSKCRTVGPSLLANALLASGWARECFHIRRKLLGIGWGTCDPSRYWTYQLQSTWSVIRHYGSCHSETTSMESLL